MRIHGLIAIVAAGVLAGCSHTKPAVSESNLTPGMAKKTIAKGVTTQVEVIEVFGPPDLVSHRDEIQVWTYDKIRYDVEERSGFLNVFGVGAGSGAAGGGVAGLSGRSTTSASTSTMLIVYFDSSDVVRDYRINLTRF